MNSLYLKGEIYFTSDPTSGDVCVPSAMIGDEDRRTSNENVTLLEFFFLVMPMKDPWDEFGIFTDP